MTERARDLLKSVLRRAEGLISESSAGPEEASDPSAPPVVVVGLDSAVLNADSLCRLVGDLLERRRQELGLRPLGPVITSSSPAGAGDAVTVTLAGHPVALVPGAAEPGAEAAEDAVIKAVDEIVTRAPGLLLGVGELPTGRGPQDDWYAAAAVRLVSSGRSLSALAGHDRSGPPPGGEGVGPAAMAETLLQEASRTRLVVETSEETLRRAAPEDADALVTLRERLWEATGVLLPEVSLSVVDAPPGVVRTSVNDVALPEGALGPEASWTAVVAHVEEQVTMRAHWMLTLAQVEASLERVSAVSPQLASAVSDSYTPPQVAACFHDLVLGGESVRNTLRLLWLMLDTVPSATMADLVAVSDFAPLATASSTAGRDPRVLASAVRRRRNSDNWSGRVTTWMASVYRVPVGIEEGLASSDSAARDRAAWQLARALIAQPGQGVVTTTVVSSAELIRPARRAMQAAGLPPRAVAAAELPPGAPR